MSIKGMGAIFLLTLPVAATSADPYAGAPVTFVEACRQLSQGTIPPLFVQVTDGKFVPTVSDASNLTGLAAEVKGAISRRDQFETTSDFTARRNSVIFFKYPYFSLEMTLREGDLVFNPDTRELNFDKVFSGEWAYRAPSKGGPQGNSHFYFGSPNCADVAGKWTRDCLARFSNPIRIAQSSFSTVMDTESARVFFANASSEATSFENYRVYAISTLKEPFFQYSVVDSADVFFSELRCAIVYDLSTGYILARWQGFVER